MTREESSRINGAKSHGPTSEEGKQRSARNRISHGLTGNSIVLPGESQELFDELTAEYMDEYKPQTPTERDFATEDLRLGELSAATLVLVGSESPDWARRSTEAFADAIPRAELHTLEGHGHGAAVSGPELLAAELSAFFA